MKNWIRATAWALVFVIGVTAVVTGIITLVNPFYFFILLIAVAGLALVACLAAMIKEWLDMRDRWNNRIVSDGDR